MVLACFAVFLGKRGYFQDHRVEQQHGREYLAPKISSPVAKKWPRGS